MFKIQNHKNRHSNNYKNGHILNKETCLKCTDFVDVYTVGVRCLYVLNAVEARGFMGPWDFDCNGRARRIVQIPFEEFGAAILVYFQGANLFSVGPRGPLATSTFGFLTP